MKNLKIVKVLLIGVIAIIALYFFIINVVLPSAVKVEAASCQTQCTEWTDGSGCKHTCIANWCDADGDGPDDYGLCDESWDGSKCVTDPECAGGGDLACSDGTPYNLCSDTKPKYCDNGTLVNKCNSCGCPPGLICQSNGTCAGGGGCTPTPPSKVTLLSPANRSIIKKNNPLLDWQDVSSWGETCGREPIDKYFLFITKSSSSNCPSQMDPAYYSGSSPYDTGTQSSYKTSNLKWGQDYCWYAEASNNGQKSPAGGPKPITNTYSKVWTFQTADTSKFKSMGISSTEVCPGNISGNTSISGTNNPVTYYTEFSLKDNGIGVEGISEVAFAIVPEEYLSANTVSESVAASYGAYYFMALAQIDHKNINNSKFSIVNTENLPYYTSSATSGTLTNTKRRAALMDINDLSNPNNTHVEIINSTTLRVYWKVKFKDAYKYKINKNIYSKVITSNIYTAAFRKLEGSNWNSSTGSNTIDRALDKVGLRYINVQVPKINIEGPTPLSSTEFKINWGVTAYELKKAEGYMWDTLGNANITRYFPLPEKTINLTTQEPNTITDPVPSSNVYAYYRIDPGTGAVTNNLGRHDYRINSLSNPDETMNTKMYAIDSACNRVVDSGSNIAMQGSWFMTAKGDIFAPDFQTRVQKANLGGSLAWVNDHSFLSTYLASVSGESLSTSSRVSKQNFLLEGYDDWNGLPPKISSEQDWYTYLYDLVSQNSQIKQVSGASLATGQRTSNFIAAQLPGFPGYTGQILKNGNFLVDADSFCNTRTIFFINGDLTVKPNFTILNTSTEQRGCIFIVKGNIYIRAGTFHNGYDTVEGYFFASGNLNTFEDKSAGKYDGLYLKGGIFVQGSVSLARTQDLLNNIDKPSEIFEYDPRYNLLFKKEFMIKDYSIREKNYIEKLGG